MPLPTKTDLQKMDFAHKGQPFVDVSSKDAIDIKTMDYSYQAQPFVRNYGAAAPPTYRRRIIISGFMNIKFLILFIFFILFGLLGFFGGVQLEKKKMMAELCPNKLSYEGKESCLTKDISKYIEDLKNDKIGSRLKSERGIITPK
ncbi:MAG: hypothetical protein AUJ70_02005 [Candidatus Omnitrophica bacterium CG1_02_40_15]|nr:MAG: hypothetical protein AUJ70_02005 [Candidatus Omnitrophica bacterium CG1_02_40_15]